MEKLLLEFVFGGIEGVREGRGMERGTSGIREETTHGWREGRVSEGEGRGR